MFEGATVCMSVCASDFLYSSLAGLALTVAFSVLLPQLFALPPARETQTCASQQWREWIIRDRKGERDRQRIRWSSKSELSKFIAARLGMKRSRASRFACFDGVAGDDAPAARLGVPWKTFNTSGMSAIFQNTCSHSRESCSTPSQHVHIHFPRYDARPPIETRIP